MSLHMWPQGNKIRHILFQVSTYDIRRKKRKGLIWVSKRWLTLLEEVLLHRKLAGSVHVLTKQNQHIGFWEGDSLLLFSSHFVITEIFAFYGCHSMDMFICTVIMLGKSLAY